jgi:hypothetical protein
MNVSRRSRKRPSGGPESRPENSNMIAKRESWSRFNINVQWLKRRPSRLQCTTHMVVST